MNNTDTTFAFTLTVEQLQQIIRDELSSFLSNTLPNYTSTVSNCGTKIVGLKKLAEYLHCGVNFAHKLTIENKIPFHRIGNRYHYFTNDIDIAMRSLV